MSSMPELCDITNTLAELQGEFFQLGLQLKLKYKQLKAIEDKYKDQSRCLIEAINLWQQNNTSGECSWSTLAEAVKRVGGHDKLVSELRKRDMARDLMEVDSKPQAPHPPETERANEGCLANSSLIKARVRRCDSRESEDESGYSSKNDSVQSGGSSESEVECFERAPSCGCSASGEKPCSLHTLCASRCPNPTKKRGHILRKKSKASVMSSQSEIPFEEEYDFEDYEESTKEIQKSFGSFVCKTSYHFKTSNVDIEELILYIRSTEHHYRVMKSRMEELSKVTHFAGFFRIIIDQACSWFDYGIIKDLILRFCASAKGCLKEYEACFKEYAEQRLPKGMKHIEIDGGARKGGKQLVIKIDREWEEVTFSDLNKLRGTFASILNIRKSDLYLADIREGCIMMTFMITEELGERLFPSKRCLSSSQIKSLKNKGVLSVKCGSLSWRAASNNKNNRARPETRAKMAPSQRSMTVQSFGMGIHVGIMIMMKFWLALFFPMLIFLLIHLTLTLDNTRLIGIDSTDSNSSRNSSLNTNKLLREIEFKVTVTRFVMLYAYHLFLVLMSRELLIPRRNDPFRVYQRGTNFSSFQQWTAMLTLIYYFTNTFSKITSVWIIHLNANELLQGTIYIVLGVLYAYCLFLVLMSRKLLILRRNNPFRVYQRGTNFPSFQRWTTMLILIHVTNTFSIITSVQIIRLNANELLQGTSVRVLDVLCAYCLFLVLISRGRLVLSILRRNNPFRVYQRGTHYSSFQRWKAMLILIHVTKILKITYNHLVITYRTSKSMMKAFIVDIIETKEKQRPKINESLVNVNKRSCSHEHLT